jgi:hypothetical protein
MFPEYLEPPIRTISVFFAGGLRSVWIDEEEEPRRKLKIVTSKLGASLCERWGAMFVEGDSITS